MSDPRTIGRDRQKAQALHAAARKDQVLGAVKEAIGEVLLRRARELIGTDDNLLFMHLDTDDLITVAEIVGRDFERDGLENEAGISLSSKETVGDLAAALYAAIFAEKDAQP